MAACSLLKSLVAEMSNEEVDTDSQYNSNDLFISASFNSLFEDSGGEKVLEALISGTSVIPISQKIMFEMTESPSFNAFITACAILNLAIILCEIYSARIVGGSYYVRAVDSALLGIFTFEVLARAWAWRIHFFKTWWLVFDLVIVLVGWTLPLGRTFILQMTPQVYTILALVRAARLIRVFRTLKSLKTVEAIETILQTLYLSLPALTTIWLLTLLIGYFYTVMSVFLFGAIDPDNFGSLQKSAKVYLQVSSLDLWSTIYLNNKSEAPSLFPVLVSYIIIQTFVVLNLLTAVIVDNLAMLRKKLSKTRSKKDKTNKRKSVFLSREKSDRKKVETSIHEFGLSEYYSRDIPIRTQSCMTNYFQNLAALEFNQNQVHRHQKMLEEMVELLKKQESIVKAMARSAGSGSITKK